MTTPTAPGSTPAAAPVSLTAAAAMPHVHRDQGNWMVEYRCCRRRTDGRHPFTGCEPGPAGFAWAVEWAVKHARSWHPEAVAARSAVPRRRPGDDPTHCPACRSVLVPWDVTDDGWSCATCHTYGVTEALTDQETRVA